MSANLSAKVAYTFGLSLWVVFVFMVAQIVIGLLQVSAEVLIPALAGVNDAILVTIASTLVYILSIGILIMVPYLLKRKKVTLETLGISRLMSWTDIGVGILATLPYFILTGVLTFTMTQLWSGFDVTQEQTIPFTNLVMRYEFLVAFLTLVVLAPVAEELLFRGYLLGKMTEKISRWSAVVITALVFGALHLPGAITAQGIELQWAVAFDTFALGLVLGSMRIFTGSVWAGILLHMLKNAIAFYFLFINPSMPGTL